jgi:hypothetical protein
MTIKFKGEYDTVSTLMPFAKTVEKAIGLYQDRSALTAQADLLKEEAEALCAEVVLETGIDKFATEEDGTITLQEGRMFLNEKKLRENLLKAGVEGEVIETCMKKSKTKGSPFYVYRAPKIKED